MKTIMDEHELRKLRTDYNFKRKYGEDGYTQLMAFVDQHAMLSEISGHFRLTNSRISQILEVLLGMPYSVWLARAGVRRKKVPGHEAK